MLDIIKEYIDKVNTHMTWTEFSDVMLDHDIIIVSIKINLHTFTRPAISVVFEDRVSGEQLAWGIIQ
jgi:hypothetical protein